MTNKKITQLRSLFLTFRLSIVAALVLAGTAAAFAPTVVMAQDAAEAAPKCAVVNYGEVACPLDVGKGTTDCFIRNPGNVDNPYEFVKGECNDPAFTSPAVVKCDQNVPESQQYCDKAVQCANQQANPPAANDPNAVNCDLTNKYINPLIITVSALVGIGVTISIIYGGIQYASSADDPGAVSKAKARILNSILVLVAYGLFYAFLNWIIPGGL